MTIKIKTIIKQYLLFLTGLFIASMGVFNDSGAWNISRCFTAVFRITGKQSFQFWRLAEYAECYTDNCTGDIAP